MDREVLIGMDEEDTSIAMVMGGRGGGTGWTGGRF